MYHKHTFYREQKNVTGATTDKPSKAGNNSPGLVSINVLSRNLGLRLKNADVQIYLNGEF